MTSAAKALGFFSGVTAGLEACATQIGPW